ncbi:condensation domain-containing protein [Streptomyces lydicus]|nr:condensation domain-containing protein [Streptomyces lydicus]
MDRHRPTAPLPALPGAPAHGPYRASRRTMVLPADVRDGVLAACRELGVTPFAYLATVFQASLAAAGVTAPALGFPMAGRTPSDEGLVGCFIRTAVLPSAGHAETFADAVREAGGHVVAALEHGTVSSDTAARGRAAYHAWFVLQNTPTASSGPGGTSVEPVPQQPATTKFALTLDVTDTGSQLVCWFDFAADVLGDELPQRVADGFRAALTAALADPGAALDEVRAAAAVRPAPAARRAGPGLRSVSRRGPARPAGTGRHPQHGHDKQGDETS